MVNQKENRNELREILRKELPVLRAKAKVSQEDQKCLEYQDKPITHMKLESE